MGKRHVGSALLVLALALCLPVCAQAQTGTYTVLHSFNGSDGSDPLGSLILSGSTLYGMTYSGGTGYGNIFSEPVTGGAPTTLFAFDSTHGSWPGGSLILSGGTLYGMTAHGGAYSKGTIFSEPVAGGTPTVLFSFDGTQGANPYGSLILSGTSLYGMTSAGGANTYGVIFRQPVTGGAPTTLFNFDKTSHGAWPYGSLIQSGGTLYGGAYQGGAHNYGTIFSEPLAGGTPTTLYSFDGTNHGAIFNDSLVLSGDGSTLYGMTYRGGPNDYGAIFSEPVAGGTPTILFLFDGTHGASPCGSLILSGGTLYGMTSLGGTYGHGTIFSEPVAGGTPTVLFSFDSTQGSIPYGSLILSADGSTLYGMTEYGGDSGDGTIFSLTVPEPATLSLLALGGLVILRRRRKG